MMNLSGEEQYYVEQRKDRANNSFVVISWDKGTKKIPAEQAQHGIRAKLEP